MESKNIVDKYAVAVIKKCKVVKHLVNSKSGKFLKTVFFLRADTVNSAEVKITRKPIKNDDKDMGPIKSNLDLQ